MDAVGLPGQVQSGDQGVLVDALVLERKRVERWVLKQHIAVDGCHERAGIGDQVIGLCRVLGQCGLGLGNRNLFVRKGCAAVLVTPLAQHFIDYLHFCATGLPMGLQGRNQTRLAGALGTEDGKF